MEYPLCQQTVTLYRKDGTRLVLEGCALQNQDRQYYNAHGRVHRRRFLLVVPGDRELKLGDRVLEGIGPEEVDWKQFVPELVPGLVELGNVRKLLWEGQVTHWEAEDADNY